MFELSEEYLVDIGIATMPEPAKSTLVDNIKKLIQNRLNIKLADDLTDEKVSELERISSSIDDAKWWLGENFPKYQGSAEFEQFKKQVTDGNDPASLFAQSKWFQVNIPNFAVLLQETMEEVKVELKAVGTGVPA
jgi:hypothetical protein